MSKPVPWALLAGLWATGLAPSASAVELLTESGVTLHWMGRCYDPVVVSPRSARGAMEDLDPDRITQLVQSAATAVKARCPDARAMRFDGRHGHRMVALDRPAAAAPEARTTAAPAAATATGTAAAPPAPPAVPAAGAPPPVAAGGRSPGALLQPASTLPSLASASGRDAKCDLIAQWMENSGVRPSANASQRVAQPPEALDAFRDEHLLAVFGKVFDEGDGLWRDSVYESLIGPCLKGTAAPATGLLNLPFLRPRPGAREPAGDPAETARLQRYAWVLRQAFNGQPGPLQAATISAHLREVRDHYQRANALASRAGQAPADLALFQQIDPASSLVRQFTWLTAADRKRLVDHLTQRRAALAPALVQDWVARAEALPRSTDSAARIRSDYQDLAAVVAALAPEPRQALAAKVDGWIEAGIAPEVKAQEDRLATTPATQEGARQLVAWETGFNQRFGEFGSAPSVQHARQTLADVRTRVLTPLLPAWKTQVARMPGTSAEVAARRADLVALFGATPDKSSAVYREFVATLDARDSAVQQQLAADEQNRLQQAQRAAAVAAAGPAGAAVMSASDLKRPSGPGGNLLGAIFQGDFDNLGLTPGSWELSALVGGYVNAFSSRCRAHIAEPVELMRTVCDTERVTKQGTGFYEREVSRECIRSHVEGTGVYAERSLHAATNARPLESMAGSLRTVFDMMSGRNPFEQGSAKLATVKELQTASSETVAANACNSPALTRLRVNLENYLLGNPGIGLNGTAALGVAMLPAAPGETFKDSNYARLLEDMVRASAANWAFNRYVGNSIAGVRVYARDPGGRPLRVEATYRFQGMNGAQIGSVALTFQEGRPNCLYFSDAADTCRPPERAIVTAYINGKYR